MQQHCALQDWLVNKHIRHNGDGKRVKETNAYKNLAQGIVVSGSVAVINPDVITNGDTQADNGAGTSREFGYSSANGLQYVKIDLGALFPVNKVSVWHYNGGTRTYHNTKTQVSADGVTWTTVFDSAVSGEYVETLAGKTHTFTQRSVRYVRDYLNGSTSNSGNHWTEIEVWGTATTAYVGDYFEWNGSLQTMTRYYFAGGTRVAVRNSNGSGTDGLVYLLGDHLGSASLTADPLDGDKLSELRYKAWGETRHTLTNAPTDRRYTGQVEEAGIGLYYYGARFYDPALGRFASPDSIIPQTQGTEAWDRYAYSYGNPVKYIDPSGHKPCEGENDAEGCDWKLPALLKKADTLLQKNKGVDDLNAMARIVDFAHRLYGRDWDGMAKSLSLLFLGDQVRGTGSLWTAYRSPHGPVLDFKDTGFHSDFRDGYNQPYHAWGYIAETSSPGRPVAGIIGQLTAVGGNVFHEYIQSLLGIDNGYGTSWQDYVLAERAADIGVLITDQVITPNELAEIVQTYFGVQGNGSNGRLQTLINEFGNLRGSP